MTRDRTPPRYPQGDPEPGAGGFFAVAVLLFVVLGIAGYCLHAMWEATPK
jgi:hypothetical protein